MLETLIDLGIWIAIAVVGLVVIGAVVFFLYDTIMTFVEGEA